MPFAWNYDEQVVTTPAGTAKTSPQITAITQQDWYVNRIKIRWPAGHNGLTGIYLAKSGAPIVPLVVQPVFIVANDDEEWFEIGDEMQGGLQAVTYNTGAFSHGHYLRIEYVPIAQWLGQAPVVPNIVPIG